jgi:hypothetical protein
VDPEGRKARRAPNGKRAQRRKPEEGQHAEGRVTPGEASDLREEEGLEVEAKHRGSRRKSVSGAEPNGKEARACDEQVPLRGGKKSLDRHARAEGRKVRGRGQKPHDRGASRAKVRGRVTATMEL